MRIDFEKLKDRCTQSIPEIVKSVSGLKETKGLRYSHWFKDNKSDVLAVAHMDTVQSIDFFNVARVPNDRFIFSPKLDDRLGVYTILDLLPKLGIKTDILLTDGEESCCSSADQFRTEKEYNWIVEFDRQGTDIVHYQTASDDILYFLEDFGFIVGHGSYSDIADLYLGASAFNVGIGYHNNHSHHAYASCTEYYSQIRKFCQFYHEYRDIAFPYDRDSEDDNVYYPDQNVVNYVNAGNKYADRCPYCSIVLIDDYCDSCGYVKPYSRAYNDI